MKVLQDSKEKYPWDLTAYGAEQVVKGLKTGDYTLEGYENIVCIERKRNTGEIAMNLGSKRKQFYAELERMTAFEHRYLILEFSYTDVLNFPNGSGIPAKKIPFLRMNKGFIISCLDKIPVDFGIQVIYAGSQVAAEAAVIEIFTEVINGK